MAVEQCYYHPLCFCKYFHSPQAFASSIECLILLRFCTAGISANMGTMLSELVVARYRAWVCPMLFILWPFALGLLSLAAHYIPRWRYLMLTASAPFFIVVIFAYFAPESIRWLLENGKDEKSYWDFEEYCSLEWEIICSKYQACRPSIHRKMQSKGFVFFKKNVNDNCASVADVVWGLLGLRWYSNGSC